MKKAQLKRLGISICAVMLAACMPFSLLGCGTDGSESSAPGSDVTPDSSTVGGDTTSPADTTGSNGTESTTAPSATNVPTSSMNTDNKTTGNKPTQGTQGTKPTSGNKVTIPADLGTGKTYYVSSSTGNDNNDGLSPEKAFKSVDKVNKLALQAGDNVLFKRGDTFTGAHLEPRGIVQKVQGQWITFDAYGNGAAPVFKDASKQKAAISLSSIMALGGFRIRNIEINNYLAGIVFTNKQFDGLVIENVTIRNITANKPWGEHKSFPEGLDTGYGLYMDYVRNATIKNLSVITSDIPVRMYGELTTFDNLYAYDNRVTGVMLYGAPYGSGYDAVMKSAGGITVQNSRVLYTGSAGLGVGTTGFMMQYTKNCTIKNCEVGYTTNGVGDNDGCALDWEELNINCTIDSVYAHDNDGPFLLAMEHPSESGNVSKGNKVINCISVNNGKRDHTYNASFMEHSGYDKIEQRITVENCIDVGKPGSTPYSYNSGNLMVDFPSQYIINKGFTSGLMNVYATFDDGSMDAFAVKDKAAINNSHLALSSGGKLRTNFSGSNYHTSSWLRGKAELVFMASGTDKGYSWKCEDGKITAQKVSGGKASTIKTIKVATLDVDNWYRIRVEAVNGTIKTYVNEVLVDTLKDSTYTSGTAGVNAAGNTMVDEFFVYRYASAPRSVQSFNMGEVAVGGNLRFQANNYNTPETKWTPSGNYTSWMFRAHGTGRLTLNGKGAAITRNNMKVDVSGGFNKINLTLTNATTSNKLYIDFTTDGGKTWHTKQITIQAMSNDNAYPFKALWTPFTNYVVDMSDMAQWAGTINGLRIRTDASSGFISFKLVSITK